jgi:hypothetical protein
LVTACHRWWPVPLHQSATGWGLGTESAADARDARLLVLTGAALVGLTAALVGLTAAAPVVWAGPG